MNGFTVYFDKSTSLPTRLLWENLISQVFFLLESAQERIRSAEGQKQYASLDGWWRPTAQTLNGKKGYQVPEETAVSQALEEEMRAIKQEYIIDAHVPNPKLANLDELEFSCEVPRKHKQGIGKKAKPTDFRFYRAGLEGLDLRVEAKVLTKKSDISKNYLSDKGLGRFSDPKEPYTDDLVGGMIAYTVTGDKALWMDQIQSEMDSASPKIDNFRHSLDVGTDQRLYSCVPFKLKKNPPQDNVMVFHLVLEFDSLPSARDT